MLGKVSNIRRMTDIQSGLLLADFVQLGVIAVRDQCIVNLRWLPENDAAQRRIQIWWSKQPHDRRVRALALYMCLTEQYDAKTAAMTSLTFMRDYLGIPDLQIEPLLDEVERLTGVKQTT